MTSARPSVTRTYGSKQTKTRRQQWDPIFNSSDRSSSPPVFQHGEDSDSDSGRKPSPKRKRPLNDIHANAVNQPPLKRRQTSSFKQPTKQKQQQKKSTPKSTSLTQLHFILDRSIVRSCTQCGLSYTEGSSGDESLHKTVCMRIRKGMEWGKEEERESAKTGSLVTVVKDNVSLVGGERGRIVCIGAHAGGKIGSKVSRPYAPSNSVELRSQSTIR